MRWKVEAAILAADEARHAEWLDNLKHDPRRT
jgi:hypothetical protein